MSGREAETLGKDLAARHAAEAKFHDEKYGEGERYPRHYKINPTYPIYLKMLEMAGDLAGKRVLEYGCGAGWITLDLAKAGAKVSAFDISGEAIRETRNRLAAHGYECDLAQMGAEGLTYEDEAFDVAVGFAIIHHLEIESALRELYRVLKPGGVALFAEPLGTNPLINWYRRRTPQFRTEDEAPLDLDKLAPSLARFASVEHKDFYVAALAAIGLAYVPFGGSLYPPVNAALMKVDDVLLKWFPSLGRWAWYTVLRLQK
jgi:SAM-dependent methyltransferase